MKFSDSVRNGCSVCDLTNLCIQLVNHIKIILGNYKGDSLIIISLLIK